MVASYALTSAAERSWATLNQHLATRTGAVFWIPGPAGCGKTHFLNYAVALQNQAGVLEAENSRRLICGLELSGRVRASEIQFYLLRALAERIGCDAQTSAMWHEISGVAAFTMALESARRTGIRALTVAIDFGLADCDTAAELLAMLGLVAGSFHNVKFTAIAAGRDAAPRAATPLEVAPADAREEVVVAIRRARQVNPGFESAITEAYREIETTGFAPVAIYPFHPALIVVLRALASPNPAVAPLARLARETLAAVAPLHEPSPLALVYPADALACQTFSKRLTERLGETGCEALRIARESLQHFSGREQELARELIDTLLMGYLGGGAVAISIAELETRVPILAKSRGNSMWTQRLIREILRRLNTHTGGIVTFDSDSARFDPDAAGAPAVAAFNGALDLVRNFDFTLTPARGLDELTSRLDRLDSAMADAVESAFHTRALISAALDEANLEITPEQIRSVEEYVALAEQGAAALVTAGANPARRAAAERMITAYEVLASAAALIPKMRAMREYLNATGLSASADHPRDHDPQIGALETESELLRVELGPRAFAGNRHSLDALEARFQKFKWAYAELYRDAHEQWSAEMERLAASAEDLRTYNQALIRLNAIPALGAPAGESLIAETLELDSRIVRCERAAPLSSDQLARCDCGFQLGALSISAQQSDLMGRVRRALESKLSALSQSMIARLIRQHDSEHRLDGFLKITQAAQTDALVRVLDENLARYLAGVLDENLAALDPASAGNAAHTNVLRIPPAASESDRATGKNQSDRPVNAGRRTAR